uniref:Uncharacterized protein n=1 Tax=Plectus sambesii TaxID=2011161 RepID=A0A914VRU5_9BILA
RFAHLETLSRASGPPVTAITKPPTRLSNQIAVQRSANNGRETRDAPPPPTPPSPLRVHHISYYCTTRAAAAAAGDQRANSGSSNLPPH